MEKKPNRIVLYRKEIHMVLLSSLRLANNLEGGTSLFEAGQGSVGAIFIEGRLGGAKLYYSSFWDKFGMNVNYFGMHPKT